MLDNGGVIEACNAQGENIVADYWVPLTLETVVISIDRNQIDMAITSWNDLRDSEVNVSIIDTGFFARMAVAAVCYGLEGDNFSLNSAVCCRTSL